MRLLSLVRAEWTAMAPTPQVAIIGIAVTTVVAVFWPGWSLIPGCITIAAIPLTFRLTN